MNRNSTILITGSTGMVGNSIFKYLKNKKYKNILHPSRSVLNLNNKKNILNYLKETKPEYVFAAAAYVGGIETNMKNPVDFLIKNILIQNNLLLSCHEQNINNLIFYGSSCIYPKFSKQPIHEKEILSGKLESTNEAYALAKILGLKLCEYLRNFHKRNYFTVMPTNLYGENDNYNPETSHVIPGIISKVKKAKENNYKEIKLFGTGKAKREFLYVNDLAEASIIAMKKNKKYSIVNIGSGQEINIKNLANLILKIANYKAKIIFESDVPDGTPRKLLNSSRIHSMGWKPKVSLNKGLKLVYDMFNNNVNIRS